MKIKAVASEHVHGYVMEHNIKGNGFVRALSILMKEHADMLLAVGEQDRIVAARGILNRFLHNTQNRFSYGRYCAVTSLRDVNVHEYMELQRILAVFRQLHNKKSGRFIEVKS